MDIKIGDVYMIGNCPHKIVEITDKEVIFEDMRGNPLGGHIEDIKEKIENGFFVKREVN